MKNLSKLTSEKLPHWILSCDQATYTTMPRVPIFLSNSHKNISFFFYLEGFFIREDSKKAQRSPSCARLSLHHCQHHHDHFHLYSHKSSSFGSSLGVIQTCICVPLLCQPMANQRVLLFFTSLLHYPVFITSLVQSMNIFFIIQSIICSGL